MTFNQSRSGSGFFSKGWAIFLKQAKKGVFRNFLENFVKKLAFFWSALPSPPSKLVYVAQKALLKTFSVRHPRMDILKWYKEGPLGSAGGRIPEWVGVRNPYPLKSVPETKWFILCLWCFLFLINFFDGSFIYSLVWKMILPWAQKLKYVLEICKPLFAKMGILASLLK